MNEREDSSSISDNARGNREIENVEVEIEPFPSIEENLLLKNK